MKVVIVESWRTAMTRFRCTRGSAGFVKVDSRKGPHRNVRLVMRRSAGAFDETETSL